MSGVTESHIIVEPVGTSPLTRETGHSAKPASALRLNEGQVRRFQTDGFISLDSITNRTDVARIRGMIESLHRTKAGSVEGAGFNLVQGFPIILNPHYYNSDLLRTEFFKNALAVARQLLGPRARFANDEALMKPGPNGPATPWHQDAAFRDPRYEFREISIWLPLQAVDQSNGCMEYVPGSHRGEVLPHRVPPAEPNSHALECYDGFDPGSAVPARCRWAAARSIPARPCTTPGRTTRLTRGTPTCCCSTSQPWNCPSRRVSRGWTTRTFLAWCRSASGCGAAGWQYT